MYKIESILGFFGSFASIVMSAYMLVYGFGPAVETGGGTIAGISAVIVAGAAVLMLGVSVALGCVGTSILKKDNKRGGVLLVIAGALSILPSYAGDTIYALVIPALFLTGGIMALTKRIYY